MSEEKFDYGLPVYILMEKLLCPLDGVKAYKLGLIDENFEVVKEPETIQEEGAMTPLDRLIFKVRSVAEEPLQNMTMMNTLKCVLKESTQNHITDLEAIKKRAENKVKMNSQLTHIKEDLESRGIDKNDFWNYIIEHQTQYE